MGGICLSGQGHSWFVVLECDLICRMQPLNQRDPSRRCSDGFAISSVAQGYKTCWQKAMGSICNTAVTVPGQNPVLLIKSIDQWRGVLVVNELLTEKLFQL